MSASDILLRAAELIDTEHSVGCCEAIADAKYRADQINGTDFDPESRILRRGAVDAMEFFELLSPEEVADRTRYWWSDREYFDTFEGNDECGWQEYTEWKINARVVALLLAREMALEEGE